MKQETGVMVDTLNRSIGEKVCVYGDARIGTLCE